MELDASESRLCAGPVRRRLPPAFGSSTACLHVSCHQSEDVTPKALKMCEVEAVQPIDFLVALSMWSDRSHWKGCWKSQTRTNQDSLGMRHRAISASVDQAEAAKAAKGLMV